MRPKRPAVSFDPPSTREAINANTQLSQAIQDSAANCSFVRFMDSTLRDGVVSNLRTIDGEIAGRKQRCLGIAPGRAHRSDPEPPLRAHHRGQQAF